MKQKLYTFGSYLLVAVLTAFLTLAVADHQYGLLPSKLDQLESLIGERYIGEADPVLMEDLAAVAMLEATGDRWSYYIPASEYQSYVEQSENAYVGVGITIQQLEESQGFLILQVTPGGPAEEAGLLVNDVIIGVDGTDARTLSTEEVRALVRGKEGTFVNMDVLRQGERRSFSVERRQVLTPVAEYEMLSDNIGLVTIANFDDRCAQETIAAIEALLADGAKKLIFDVRHNPGGYASELVEVLDYLLPEGELFRMVDYKGKESVDQSDEAFLNVPMAVLVNGSSYSAAEFFAAAMMEYEAAVVVGEQTTGKGFFQNTFQFTDGSAVALSVGKYYTPKGVSLEGVGITPHRVVKVDEETAAAIYSGTLSPEDDPQIREAMLLLKNQ